MSFFDDPPTTKVAVTVTQELRIQALEDNVATLNEAVRLMGETLEVHHALFEIFQLRLSGGIQS